MCYTEIVTGKRFFTYDSLPLTDLGDITPYLMGAMEEMGFTYLMDRFSTDKTSGASVFVLEFKRDAMVVKVWYSVDGVKDLTWTDCEPEDCVLNEFSKSTKQQHIRQSVYFEDAIRPLDYTYSIDLRRSSYPDDFEGTFTADEVMNPIIENIRRAYFQSIPNSRTPY